MSNSIVMAQPLGAKQKILEKQFSRGEQTSRFACMHSSLRHHLSSKSFTPFFDTNYASHPCEWRTRNCLPGWRPSWAWYLAVVPALPAVAGNPVPALTLLSYKILRAYLRFHGNQKCNIEYSLIICHLQKIYIVNILVIIFNYRQSKQWPKLKPPYFEHQLIFRRLFSPLTKTHYELTVFRS